MACRAVVVAFRSLHTSAYCPCPVDTFASVAGIEGMEQSMDLVPAAVAEGIGLACVDPCRSPVDASAVLVVGGSLAVELQLLAAGEQQMIAARSRVLHFSCLRQPLPSGQCRLGNQTTNVTWLARKLA